MRLRTEATNKTTTMRHVAAPAREVGGLLRLQQLAGNQAVSQLLRHLQRASNEDAAGAAGLLQQPDPAPANDQDFPPELIKDLRRGDGPPKGTEFGVAALQNELRTKLNRFIPNQPFYGPKTAQAVLDFKSGHSLANTPADGEFVGAATAALLVAKPKTAPDPDKEAKLEVIGERYDFMIERQRDALTAAARDVLQGKAADEDTDIGLDVLKGILKAGFKGIYGISADFLKEQLDTIEWPDLPAKINAKKSAGDAIDSLEDPAVEAVMSVLETKKEDQTAEDVADFFDAHLETVSQAGLELKERFATTVRADLRTLPADKIDDYAEKVDTMAHRAFALQREEALTQWAVSRAHKSRLGTTFDPKDVGQQVTSFKKASRFGSEKFGGVLTVGIASDEGNQDDLGRPDAIGISANIVVRNAALPGMGPRAARAFELKPFGAMEIPIIFRGKAQGNSVAFSRDEHGNLSLIGGGGFLGDQAGAWFTQVAEAHGGKTADDGISFLFSTMLQNARLVKGSLAPVSEE
jgi:peptidoglycan hydrolase-like protein with peptidoglycan-binding domain